MQHIPYKTQVISFTTLFFFLILHTVTVHASVDDTTSYIFIVDEAADDYKCKKRWHRAQYLDQQNCCKSVIIDNLFQPDVSKKACKECADKRLNCCANTFYTTQSNVQSVFDLIFSKYYQYTVFKGGKPFTFVIVGNDELFFEVSQELRVRLKRFIKNQKYFTENYMKTYAHKNILEIDQETIEIEEQEFESGWLQDAVIVNFKAQPEEKDEQESEQNIQDPAYYLSLLPFGTSSNIYREFGSALVLYYNPSWTDLALKNALDIALRGQPVSKKLFLPEPPFFHSFDMLKIDMGYTQADFDQNAVDIKFGTPKLYIIRSEQNTFYRKFRKWFALVVYQRSQNVIEKMYRGVMVFMKFLDTILEN